MQMEMAQNQEHTSKVDVSFLTGQIIAQLGNLGKFAQLLGKFVQLGELGELGGAGQLGNKTHKPVTRQLRGLEIIKGVRLNT